MQPLFLPNTFARRVFLARHGLMVARAGTGKGADLQGVIENLGFVQLDSVNTFARAHDLILWSRRQSYAITGLPEQLATRGVFEHWTHDASAIAMPHFVHWRLKMARDFERLSKRWPDWHGGTYPDKIDGVLRQIADGGAVSSGDVGKDEVRGKGGWWDWHPSKTALEFLWRSGEVSVVRRDGFKKVYDLTERVIPPEHLNARVHADETVAWACDAAMDKLGFATSGEIAAFWDLVTSAEAREWCKAAAVEGAIVPVEVEAADGSVRACFARPDILDEVPPEPSTRVRILSPFDPALRDRKRAERLFGFHYRIEIFVPAPKRQYGYYVFPVLEGDRIIGRIDMKAMREISELQVTAFWPEAGVAMGAGRIKRMQAELVRAARFAGCADVVFEEGWMRGP